MEPRQSDERDVAAGRERELGRLLAALDEVRTSRRAGFAFVSGPSGIGKSHLLASFRAAAVARGAPVIEGFARRGGSSAFGLLSTVGRGLLELAGVAGAPAGRIAQLARRLAPLQGPVAAGGVEPLALADALVELAELAGPAGPAVLLHDVDAADRGSLELLRGLLVALAAAELPGGLWLLSHRTDVAQPAPLAALSAALPGLRLPLAGLDAAGVRAFLARRDVAERLLAATAGDPSRLEALVAAAPVDLGGRRLARLAGPALEALQALALLGEPASAALVEAVAGPAAAAALEGLARERFATPVTREGLTRWSVARDADRLALLEALGPAAAALHLRAADALAAAGAPAERLAPHLLAVDPQGRGAEAAAAAAEELEARAAWAEAALHWQRALHARPARATLARLALAQLAAGDALPALANLGRARRGASTAERAPLDAAIAEALLARGDLAQAARAAARVGELDPAAAARAFVVRAEVEFLRGAWERCLALAEPAPLVSPLARVQLCRIAGKALLNLGRYDEAQARFAACEAEARAHGLAREELRAVINAGVVAHRRGDRSGAIAAYRAALARAEVDPGLRAFALGNLGALHHEAGELELALSHQEQALAAFRRAGRRKEQAHQGCNLARLLLFSGALDRAETVAAAAHADAAAIGDPYLVAQAELVRGELHEARGELPGAVRRFAEARDAFVMLKNPRYDAEAGLALARVLLARGEREAARLELSRVEAGQGATQPAIAVELALQSASLHLATAELPAAARRLARARELLLAREEGVGGDTDLEAPWQLHALSAKLREALSDPAGADLELARASRLYDEVVARVPAALRASFAALPRRAALLAAVAARAVAPTRAAARRLPEAAPPELEGLVGRAPALQKLARLLPAVGRSLATVLVRGESGTGKEKLAEAIHRCSPRRDLPLVKVNCAAMHEELLLSELFGHERGAFTGATAQRKGRFELAEGGTIFLDEIGDVSQKAQVALLRVLQEREYERVGGGRTLRADVRVIAATNRPLERMIAQGQFREDLYYRLKGVMLELPPLRERLEDLPLLSEHLLARLAAQRGGAPLRLTPDALDLLARWSWPGNVRELENVLSAVSIFAEGASIGRDAFEAHGELLTQLARAEAARPPPAPEPRPVAPSDGPLDYFELAQRRGLGLKELRAELELQMIARALEQAQGNISEAARLLQLKRSRLSQIVNGEPRLRALARAGSEE